MKINILNKIIEGPALSTKLDPKILPVMWASYYAPPCI